MKSECGKVQLHAFLCAVNRKVKRDAGEAEGKNSDVIQRKNGQRLILKTKLKHYV